MITSKIVTWQFAEAFRTPIFRSGPDKNGFNLGRLHNFQAVFGDDKRLWLLPIFTRWGWLPNTKFPDVFVMLFVRPIPQLSTHSCTNTHKYPFPLLLTLVHLAFPFWDWVVLLAVICMHSIVFSGYSLPTSVIDLVFCNKNVVPCCHSELWQKHLCLPF